jgi:hypothetical protein
MNPQQLLVGVLLYIRNDFWGQVKRTIRCVSVCHINSALGWGLLWRHKLLYGLPRFLIYKQISVTSALR